MNRRLILIITLVIITIVGVVLYFALTRSGGSSRTVTSTFKSLLPFGSSGNVPNNNQNQSPSTIGQTDKQDTVLKRLRHLTLEPTAGDSIIEKNIDVIVDRVKTPEKAFYIRYIDRATGHIFDIKTDEPTALQISNTTIPKIYEATFTPGGNSLIARFLASDTSDQIITYFITLKDKSTSASSTSKTTDNTVAAKEIAGQTLLKDATGIYLEPNIKEIAMTPSGKKLLSLVYTTEGGRLSLLDTGGKKPTTILASPLREWLLSLPNETKAVITTKPSGIANGYAYSLDLASGKLRKIIGEIAGLTLLPNKDGDTYLGAGTPNGSVKLFAYFDREEQTKILPIQTLPEKCVWKNTEQSSLICAVPKVIIPATYPDDWYKGRATFTDDLWQIDVKTGETRLISNLSTESGQAIDGVSLQISSDDKYLTFINKKDLTLWGLDLSLKQ